jgi:hypothetical protein
MALITQEKSWMEKARFFLWFTLQRCPGYMPSAYEDSNSVTKCHR